MTGDADSTLLFLDIDGPLIPFGGDQNAYTNRIQRHRSHAASATDNPLLRRLNPDDGAHLAALGCDLVWATSWTSDANEVVAPLLGLPALPVVLWPETDDIHIRGLHWKTAALVEYAAGRSFIWLDDEITNTDRRWVAATYPAPTLLHRADPRTGLTRTDFATISQWLKRPPTRRLLPKPNKSLH